MPQSYLISSRRVSFEMHERFAALSGDRNPMHMDPVAARRTQAGAPVVHGIHTLLWALQCLVESGTIVSPIVRIQLKFLKWLYVGDESSLVVPAGGRTDPGSMQVEVAGLCILSAEITYGKWSEIGRAPNLPSSHSSPRTTAADRSFGDLAGCEGVAYTASPGEASALFPRLADYLSGGTIAEIAACSYIVGMELPGMHSMFSKIDLTLFGQIKTSVSADIHYRLRTHDERFRKMRIEVAGQSITGTLEAFLRLPPIEQPSMHSVSKMVLSGEFGRMQPLIIGGSRGLGELTAKLVAAGGGKPTISYAVGKSDAERIASEIRTWGGSADVLHYDVRQNPAPQLSCLKSGVTHMFYFATNSIFRPKKDLVSNPILMDFVMYYLQGFHDLCVQLLQPGEPYLLNRGKLSAYYPSSVAVEERPAGMTEYSMVKAAGEQMCRDMNQYLPGLRILMTRLPRLRTDQTASVIPEREVDPVGVLLPIIREMNKLAAGI